MEDGSVSSGEERRKERNDWMREVRQGERARRKTAAEIRGEEERTRERKATDKTRTEEKQRGKMEVCQNKEQTPGGTEGGRRRREARLD